MTNSLDFTYYEILEVSPTAGISEIHEAYQKARATYNQNNPALYSMFSADEAKQLLSLVDEAYSVLSQPHLRANYDLKLKPVPEIIAETFPTSSNFQDHKTSIPSSASKTITSPQAPLTPVKKQQEPEVVLKSQYTPNPHFEQEIQNQESFDGFFLKRIREYKKIDLDDLSKITKIKKSYIQSIEANEFKKLPAEVFLRGFLIQLARLYELDEKKVSSSFIKKFKEHLGSNK